MKILYILRDIIIVFIIISAILIVIITILSLFGCESHIIYIKEA